MDGPLYDSLENLTAKEIMLDSFILVHSNESLGQIVGKIRDKKCDVCFVKQEGTGSLFVAGFQEIAVALLDVAGKDREISDIATRIDFVVEESGLIKTVLTQSKNYTGIKYIPVLKGGDVSGYLLKEQNTESGLSLLEEMYEKEREFRRKLEARDDFLSIVSHDIRAPFSIIISMCEVISTLDGKDSNLSKVQTEFLEKIVLNSKRGLELVSDLLDLGKLNSEGNILNLTEVYLPEIINDLAEHLKNLCRSKKITIETDEMEQVYASIDRKRFSQIIQNLVLNAVKFSPLGGKITLSCTLRENRQAVVSVKDEGRGIPEKSLNKLFERFKQGDEGIAKELGVGLGLYIVRQFTSLHKGFVEVESVENKGSVFSVVLPNGRSEKAVSAQNENKIKILVVEDDRDILELIVVTFRAKGFILFKAEDGEKALEIYKLHKPDLVISDLKVPKIDGFELSRYIRNMDPNQEILFMSGYYQNAIKNEYAKNIFGVEKVMAKPFTLDELNSSVASSIANIKKRNKLAS